MKFKTNPPNLPKVKELPAGNEADIVDPLSRDTDQMLMEVCDLYNVDKVAVMKMIDKFPTPAEIEAQKKSQEIMSKSRAKIQHKMGVNTQKDINFHENIFSILGG